MGILTSSGSFARVNGPVVLLIYYNYGNYALTGTILGTVILAYILIIAAYKRLVPCKIPVVSNGKIDNTDKNGDIPENSLKFAAESVRPLSEDMYEATYWKQNEKRSEALENHVSSD